MLSVQKLSLTNFRSWEKVTINFNPGITVIQGKNGSGKTSIRMGLQYGLVGNIKDLSIKDLIREGCSNFKIEITTDRGKLIRSKGKSTFIDKNNVSRSVRDMSVFNTLRKIAPFIFLTPETSQFIDLTEAKRKELLSSLLDEIKIFRNLCYGRVKEVKAIIDEKTIYLTSRIEVLVAQKLELEDRITSVSSMYESEKEKLKKAESLQKVGQPFSEKEYTKYLNQVDSIKKKLKKFHSDIQGIDIQTESITQKLAFIESLEDKINEERHRIASLESNIQDKVQLLEGYYSKCPNCKEDLVCSNCGKKVIVDEKKYKQIQIDIKKTKGLLKSAKERLEKYLKNPEIKKVSSLKKELQDLKSKKLNLLNKKDTLASLLPEINTKIEEYEKWKRGVEFVEKLSNKDLVSQLEKQLKSLRRKLKKVDSKLERVKRQRRVLQKLAKDMSLLGSIFSTTLPELYYREFVDKFSKCVNMFANYLGGMEIEFKDVGDKLLTFINGREYKKASTGEKQRAKIATTLGFSILYTHADIIVFDEVFDLGLDEEGITALCVILQSVLKNIFSKIIIITHNKLLLQQLQPDTMYLVEKDKETGVSRIVSEI